MENNFETSKDINYLERMPAIPEEFIEAFKEQTDAKYVTPFDLFDRIGKATNALQLSPGEYDYAKAYKPKIEEQEFWAINEPFKFGDVDPLYFWFTEYQGRFFGIHTTRAMAQTYFTRIKIALDTLFDCVDNIQIAQILLIVILPLLVLTGACNSSKQTTQAKPLAAVANSDEQTKPKKAKSPKPVETLEKEAHYCGAKTKKGTDCTRRVKKDSGFCWQHKAQETGGGQ